MTADTPLEGRKLRLLWITPFWPTRTLPQAQPQREVARLLAEAGHEVVILGASIEELEPTLRTHPNLIDDPYIESGAGAGRQLRVLRDVLRKARRYHAERPFDLAYVRFAHPVGITAAVVATLLRLPLVYQEEAPDLERVTRRPIERLAMLAMKYRADLRTASGPKIAQAVGEILERPVYAIPLPVDTSRFAPRVRQLSHGDEVRLVAVGRLHEQKGTMTLVEAVSRLPERFRVTLVGEGKGRGDAEKLVARLGVGHRVTFAGARPPVEVPGFLENAHMFVLPSTVESFCVAAAEALAAGLPAVVTRCGGPEYFVTRRDGRVVEPRDPAAFADAIVDVADRYADFDPIDIARRADARFGPQRSVWAYEAMFAYLLGMAPLPAAGPYGPFWFSDEE